MSTETVQFSVLTDMDRVVFRINRRDFFIPYAQVFRMAQCLQIICKRSKQLIHEREHWAKLANTGGIEIPDYNTVTPYSQVKGKFNWEFRIESELIHFQLGDYHTSFHFAAGLQLSFMIRIAGRKAKAWAGDLGKTKIAVGMLTDAEENYRLGI